MGCRKHFKSKEAKRKYEAYKHMHVVAGEHTPEWTEKGRLEMYRKLHGKEKAMVEDKF